MTYEHLLDEVYNIIKVDRESFSLTLLLYYTFQGVSTHTYLVGHEGMQTLYHLANDGTRFIGEIVVSCEPRARNDPPRFMNLLLGFRNDQLPIDDGYRNAPNDDRHNSLAFNNSGAEDESEDSEIPPSYNDSDDDNREDNQTELSQNDSDDEVPLQHSPNRYNHGIYQGFPTGPVEPYNEEEELRGAAQPDFDYENVFDFWNPSLQPTVIRAGMVFKSKDEVMHAIRTWNVERNRELHVNDSRPRCWKVICQTRSPNYKRPLPPNTPPCLWRASACQRKNQPDRQTSCRAYGWSHSAFRWPPT